ncbi:unnamed protein product [Rangifer tarandus platyrhynchus]|uniref:Uncharacterized protein n=1 Tax=Rangifer tarandus platyrhynchus TaxID=3082113 RepID=A0AC60A8J3_RANTA
MQTPNHQDPQRWIWGVLTPSGHPAGLGSYCPGLGMMSADRACPSLEDKSFFKNPVSANTLSLCSQHFQPSFWPSLPAPPLSEATQISTVRAPPGPFKPPALCSYPL